MTVGRDCSNEQQPYDFSLYDFQPAETTESGKRPKVACLPTVHHRAWWWTGAGKLSLRKEVQHLSTFQMKFSPLPRVPCFGLAGVRPWCLCMAQRAKGTCPYRSVKPSRNGFPS